jgi:RNA polymerase sigma-70 factor (ECF subfamily)
LILEEEEKALINACIGGKREAQYQLYKKYSKAMFNTCLRMVNDQSDAEDVLQNAFIDVFTKLKMFRFESTLGAWIKRIVINNCVNMLRQKKTSAFLVEALPEVEDNVAEDFQPNVSVIKQAINQLPEGYRTIFCLYTLEGYDHLEISEILNISESTSKSQYSRARAKVYDIMRTNGSLGQIYD